MNPINKYNKLKRFAQHISLSYRDGIPSLSPLAIELTRVDCLNNDDIFTRRDMTEKLDNIANCASLLELRKYENGEVRVHNASYCHNPAVCPVCADRVSKRRRAIFSEPIKKAVRRFGIEPAEAKKRGFPRGYTGVYLATATIKPGKNLKERINTLFDSVKRMRKKGQKRNFGYSSGEWLKVKAGIGNAEIKIGGGSGAWHVHEHFLLFTSSPLDLRVSNSEYYVTDENGAQKQVSKFTYEWWRSTKGQGVNFDVTPVQYVPKIHGNEMLSFADSVAAQAQEVLKYSTQLSTNKGTGLLSCAQYIELIQRRGNRRLFNAIGLLRCDKRNPESLISISERELARMEYVDLQDSLKYEIFASRWQDGGTYSEPEKQDGAIFKNSDDINTHWFNLRRKAFQAQTAIYQGAYRKERNSTFKNKSSFFDKEVFSDYLDDMRDSFKNRVSELWSKFRDSDFLPDFLCDFNSGGMQELREKYTLALDNPP